MTGPRPATAGPAATGPARTGLVKCVAWDIDNTLITGAFIESGDRQPPADPAMTAVLAELAARGIVAAIASRNPPTAAQYAGQVTGATFVAAECGWDRKSAAISRIAAGLGIGTDAVAFVDDDPYERAEVTFALPEVLTLSPEDMTDALGWPAFSPAVVTAEASRRSELYLDRRRRQQAGREFGGSREEFLRYCRTEITITGADAADADRLAELSVRTHQFNSAARGTTSAVLRSMIAAPDTEALVLAVRLRDRFGDDGIVGGCVTEPGPGGTWTVRLLVMSCRAMGRGVIDALLAWLAAAAASAGARELIIPAVLNDRNVPLRLALAAAGFRAGGATPQASPAEDSPAEDSPAEDSSTARQALFRRALGGPRA
jgi:FkbH-like protein